MCWLLHFVGINLKNAISVSIYCNSDLEGLILAYELNIFWA